MAELSKLVIVFGTDLDEMQRGLKKAQDELKRTQRAADTIGDRFRDVGRRISRSMDDALPASRAVATAMAGVAAALIGAGIAAVKMASDADETRNKFNVVFGDMADSVRDFANTSADEMGRSRLQMEEFLAKSEAILKPLLDSADGADQMAAAVGRLTGDLDEGKTLSAKMSQALATLAVDLGSFLNVSDTEALDRLISGMLGSTEAVDQLGINLRSTELQAEALRQGISGNVETMDEATKMFLRFAVIMRQTKDAQGDAARTSGSFANQLKTLGGNLRDLGAAAGAQITQTLGLDKALQGVNKVLGDLKKTIDEKGLAGALNEILSPQLETTIFAIAGAITGMLVPALIRLGAVLAASLIPLAPWIAAFAALGVAAAIVVRNMPAVVDLMRQVGDVISGAAENVKKLPKDVQDMVAQLDRVTKGLRDKIEKGTVAFKDFEEAITATDAVLKNLKSRQDASSIGMQFQLGLIQAQRDQLVKSRDAWLAQKLGIEGSTDATNENADAGQKNAIVQAQVAKIVEESEHAFRAEIRTLKLTGKEFDENEVRAKFLEQRIGKLVDIVGNQNEELRKAATELAGLRKEVDTAEVSADKLGRRIHQWNPIFLQVADEMRRLTLRLELFGGSGDALKDRLDVVTLGMDILFKAGKENSGMFKELKEEADHLREELGNKTEPAFTDLENTVKETMEDIATAVKDGLRDAIVAFVDGTGDIEDIWRQMKTNIIRMTVDLFLETEGIAAGMKAGFTALPGEIAKATTELKAAAAAAGSFATALTVLAVAVIAFIGIRAGKMHDDIDEIIKGGAEKLKESLSKAGLGEKIEGQILAGDPFRDLKLALLHEAQGTATAAELERLAQVRENRKKAGFENISLLEDVGFAAAEIEDILRMREGLGLDIPATLARGGIVTAATLALIGEGREPEAVLPLSKLDALLDGRGGRGGRAPGSVTNHFTLAPTKESAAEQMRAVQRFTRRLALDWGLGNG